MGNNATKYLVRVGVNGPSRARILLWFLGVVFVLMAVREDRKLQQVMVVFSRAVAAVARGLVTLPVAELDQGFLKAFFQRTVAPLVVAICEPVGVTAAGMAVGEGCRVKIAFCTGLFVTQDFSTVLALPGLNGERLGNWQMLHRKW